MKCMSWNKEISKENEEKADIVITVIDIILENDNNDRDSKKNN